MNGKLKSLLKDEFKGFEADLCVAFIQRCLWLTKENKVFSMITMHGWLFLSSFEQVRSLLIESNAIGTAAHLGARAFGSISGEVVQAVAFSVRRSTLRELRPVFMRLTEGAEEEKRERFLAGDRRYAHLGLDAFSRVFGKAICYWVHPSTIDFLTNCKRISGVGETKRGLYTGNNDLFLRL